MSPPAVALLPSAFAPHVGGVEELSRRLALQLRARGSDTIVITNRFPPTLGEHETVDGIPVYRARFRFPELRPRHLAGWAIGTLSARSAVARAAREHRSSLVHVQCVSSNGYYARRLAHAENLPLVVSLQGELTMDAGQAFQRSPVLRREWRQLLTRADVVTGCSQQVVDEAVAEFGPALATKARVVRNGVDVAAVRAAEPESRARPYVFALGRFVPQKGFDLLIDAFASIAVEHPQLDLVLAGDGPERAALTRRAAATGYGERIVFLGAVAPERAFALHRGAAAFVLPSRHEPQGIVVVEAMAAGTPVVAARVGGVPETVHDGVNGLLFDGGDAAALAATLRSVLRDPDGVRAMVDRASVDVQAYDWNAITDQYEHCYADAARLHGRVGARG